VLNDENDRLIKPLEAMSHLQSAYAA
jgi:hypothetical protein